LQLCDAKDLFIKITFKSANNGTAFSYYVEAAGKCIHKDNLSETGSCLKYDKPYHLPQLTFSEKSLAFLGIQHMKELCTNGFQVPNLTVAQKEVVQDAGRQILMQRMLQC